MPKPGEASNPTCERSITSRIGDAAAAARISGNRMSDSREETFSHRTRAIVTGPRRSVERYWDILATAGSSGGIVGDETLPGFSAWRALAHRDSGGGDDYRDPGGPDRDGPGQAP